MGSRLAHYFLCPTYVRLTGLCSPPALYLQGKLTVLALWEPVLSSAFPRLARAETVHPIAFRRMSLHSTFGFKPERACPSIVDLLGSYARILHRYILIAISEILASITGLEYAFTKAPKNMRSLVVSIFLFMSAVSSAIGEGFVGEFALFL